jgi:hypothetical protein
MMRRTKHTTIGALLRKRFKSPYEALDRLGIPRRLLRAPGLAYDAAAVNSKTKLDDLLAQHLSGFELQRARDLLRGIDPRNPDGSWDPETAAGSDEEQNVEVAEDEVDRRVERALDRLRPYLSEDDLEEALPLVEGYIREQLRDRRNGDTSLPRNALHEGMSGRLGEKGWDQERAEKRQAARDRQMARDERSFARHFPEVKRLMGTPLEAGLTSELERCARMQPLTERAIAADAKGAKGFSARFPTAARIGVA